jgi:uncharacterized short protein YbdD (DUF466 family)
MESAWLQAAEMFIGSSAWDVYRKRHAERDAFEKSRARRPSGGGGGPRGPRPPTADATAWFRAVREDWWNTVRRRESVLLLDGRGHGRPHLAAGGLVFFVCTFAADHRRLGEQERYIIGMGEYTNWTRSDKLSAIWREYPYRLGMTREQFQLHRSIKRAKVTGRPIRVIEVDQVCATQHVRSSELPRGLRMLHGSDVSTIPSQYVKQLFELSRLTTTP